MNNILSFLQDHKQSFKTASLLIALFTCANIIHAQGQQAKSPVQLADQYFVAGEYYTAANLYEQYLHPSKKQKNVSEFPLNIKARRISTTNRKGTD